MKKKIIISQCPVAQPRPRVTRWGTFNPAKDKKNWTKYLLSQEIEEIIETPVELEIIFYMKIPKSTSKKKQKLMMSNEIKHTKKPDIDNLIIFILNCMTDIVYIDDNQIYKIMASKQYDEYPRTEITIKW